MRKSTKRWYRFTVIELLKLVTVVSIFCSVIRFYVIYQDVWISWGAWLSDVIWKTWRG